MFVDRADAGRALAEEVGRLSTLAVWAAASSTAPPVAAASTAPPVVAALPRGGVPVGFQVARHLRATLVVLPVAKVGAPGREELALGAVAPGGVEVLNGDVVAALHLGEDELKGLVAKAAAKVSHQLEAYRGGDGISLMAGRLVIVVDDGLATGASMRAALLAVRQADPLRVVLAVPVAPPEVLAALAPLVDDVACVLRPEHMYAVGAWYEDFTQTSDAEVARLLAEAGK
jgi:putative phosphoribosyl transferase